MPQYLVTVEQEGIAYPFLVDASERGRAIAQIKRHWLEQGWGAYDALRIETLRKDWQGIARPARLTVKTYSRVQALVHHCWLDMHDGQVDRDQVLRQLCIVLTEVLPSSIAGEVFEIVGAHERAGLTAFTAAALRPVQPASAWLLAQEALADGAREQEQEQMSDTWGGTIHRPERTSSRATYQQEGAMTQVRLRLSGTTRQAVEEVLAHLQTTASVYGQRLTPYYDQWRLEATLALPASSQPTTSGSEHHPLLLEELGLPKRTLNALLNQRVTTVEALQHTSEERLRSFRLLGAKGFQAIVESMKRHGLYAASELAKTLPD